MNKNEIFSINQIPRRRDDDTNLSVPVFMIHKNSAQSISFYNYISNEWEHSNKHFLNYDLFFSKWYYPPVTAADAFPRQFTIGDRVECIDDSIIIPGTIVRHINLNSIYTISGIQKCVCGELEIQLKELLTLNITWNEVDCLKCGYISVQNAFYSASRFRLYNQNPVANQ